MISPIRFEEDELRLLDQRVLPHEETWISCRSAGEVAEAIREMVVRGAPAIGVSAAFGVLLAARDASDKDDAEYRSRLAEAGESLEAARPTAVNLAWAVRRMLSIASRELDNGTVLAETTARLEEEARAILEEDVEINRRIGQHGSMLVPDGARVLTHCNTGSLATAGYGTALGVVRAAVEEGKSVTVVADETRPFLQGSRLTAWECVRDSIPVEVITDSMAGALMARGEIDLVVVGADRVARNGDVANKIGTYMVAVLARRHGVPFYVAAPTSTIDASVPDGSAIPIEERDPLDVLEFGGTRVAPEGARARHIAFDITPASIVTALVTEEGIARAPYSESIARMLGLEPEISERPLDSTVAGWDEDEDTEEEVDSGPGIEGDPGEAGVQDDAGAEPFAGDDGETLAAAESGDAGDEELP